MTDSAVLRVFSVCSWLSPTHTLKRSGVVSESVEEVLTFGFVCFLSSEKAEMFLEVLGNSELRSETGEAVRDAAARLCDHVTDCQETGDPHPCLDTTLLKVGCCTLSLATKTKRTSMC